MAFGCAALSWMFFCSQILYVYHLAATRHCLLFFLSSNALLREVMPGTRLTVTGVLATTDKEQRKNGDSRKVKCATAGGSGSLEGVVR